MALPIYLDCKDPLGFTTGRDTTADGLGGALEVIVAAVKRLRR